MKKKWINTLGLKFIGIKGLREKGNEAVVRLSSSRISKPSRRVKVIEGY